MAIDGRVIEIVVTYKDSLTRFGYELIEDLFKAYSGGNMKIINGTLEEDPEIGLAKDVLQVLNMFMAKRME